VHSRPLFQDFKASVCARIAAILAIRSRALRALKDYVHVFLKFEATGDHRWKRLAGTFIAAKRAAWYAFDGIASRNAFCYPSGIRNFNVSCCTGPSTREDWLGYEEVGAKLAVEVRETRAAIVAAWEVLLSTPWVTASSINC
jgi:hypothetical protein